MQSRTPSRYAQSGFTFIEVIVATFILGVATVGVMGLATLGIRYSFENERQNVAQALVNQQMEIARSLVYEDVGYTDAQGREADGVLERLATVARNQQSYELVTVVKLVDDPSNGTLPAGTLDEATADYKEVTAHTSWTSAGGESTRSVSATTIISKGSRACTPGASGACPGVGPPSGDGAAIPNVDCPASGSCPTPPPPSPTPCPPGAVACPECYSDSQCPGGEICDLDSNTCIEEPGACRTSADCTGGQVCIDGYCAPPCTGDGDCAPGQICNVGTGICTPPCNGGGAACPVNTQCNDETGLCDPAPTPSPTPVPTACVGNGCSGGAWCDPDEGICKPPCDSDSQCGYGQTCEDNGDGSGGHCEDEGPPDGECGNGVECPSGQECNNGICEGNWCTPITPIVDCSSLSPVDPGCAASTACTFGGRYVISYEEQQDTRYDPMCGSYTFAYCKTIFTWVPCPDCDDPPDPRECSDGIDNDEDCRADNGNVAISDLNCHNILSGNPDYDAKPGFYLPDPGCYTDWDLSKSYNPDDNHETNGQCVDFSDNNNDGTANFAGGYVKNSSDEWVLLPADSYCTAFTDPEEDPVFTGCTQRYNPANGHYYLFCGTSQNQRTYEEAKTFCEELDGYEGLLKINDIQEREWIAQQTAVTGFGFYGTAWLGLEQADSQVSPRLGWRWWPSGEQFVEPIVPLEGNATYSWPLVWNYWYPFTYKQPRDVDNAENNQVNHAVLSSFGAYDFAHGYISERQEDSLHGHVCESVVSDPTPPQIDQHCFSDIGPDGLKYYFCPRTVALDGADALCSEKSGFRLAEFTNPGVADWVANEDDKWPDEWREAEGTEHEGTVYFLPFPAWVGLAQDTSGIDPQDCYDAEDYWDEGCGRAQTASGWKWIQTGVDFNGTWLTGEDGGGGEYGEPNDVAIWYTEYFEDNEENFAIFGPWDGYYNFEEDRNYYTDVSINNEAYFICQGPAN